MARLADAEIEQLMPRVSGWQRRDNAIRRELKFKDFVASIGFVNKVALLAERADHHPDIAISYNRVVLDLFTHSEGGLTAKDFDLAQKIDSVV